VISEVKEKANGTFAGLTNDGKLPSIQLWKTSYVVQMISMHYFSGFQLLVRREDDCYERKINQKGIV
jgi:hypothetical protein